MKTNVSKFLAISFYLVGLSLMGAAHARDQVRLVGSSTVLPYSEAVAKSFASKNGGALPIVQFTGTGGGMKAFCQGIGEAFPDIANASRAMNKAEFEFCVSNGVNDITEALIGYDGVALATSLKSPENWSLSDAQIFLALAAEVPQKTPDGKFKWVANPYKKWSQIAPTLPDVPILVYGPSPTSGTHDALVQFAMYEGCEDIVGASNFFEKKCLGIRQDGPFVEAGEIDNQIVDLLSTKTNTIGIFGYPFLYDNLDRIKAVSVNGIEPNAETIASFQYPLSRPLYIYIKNAHRGLIPNLKEFIVEYMSDDSLARGGYNNKHGLTVLSAEVLKKNRADAIAGKKLIVQ
jgi:phosphate transport system substrate-binding protein